MMMAGLSSSTMEDEKSCIHVDEKSCTRPCIPCIQSCIRLKPTLSPQNAESECKILRHHVEVTTPCQFGEIDHHFRSGRY